MTISPRAEQSTPPLLCPGRLQLACRIRRCGPGTSSVGYHSRIILHQPAGVVHAPVLLNRDVIQRLPGLCGHFVVAHRSFRIWT